MVPYKHALWCTVGGEGPLWNSIELKGWSKDGHKVHLMLGSHNFMIEYPDTELELGEYPEGEYYKATFLETPEQFLAKRPAIDPQCSGGGLYSLKGQD